MSHSTPKEQLKHDLGKILNMINKRNHNHALRMHEDHSPKRNIPYVSVDEKEVIDKKKNLELTHNLADISLRAGKFILFSHNGYRLFTGDTFDARFAEIYEFIIGYALKQGIEEVDDISGRKPWLDYLDSLTIDNSKN